MRTASLSLAIIAAFATYASAIPMKRQVPGMNVNQGSSRPVILQADGSVEVDGLVAANDLIGSEIACLLEERDCKTTGIILPEFGPGVNNCADVRISCQSGNGINGISAALNKERGFKRRATQAGVNINQGSQRVVSANGDGTATVDGLVAANESLALQIACLIDEKDCKANGIPPNLGPDVKNCADVRISCQSGNGLNGLRVKLNNE